MSYRLLMSHNDDVLYTLYGFAVHNPDIRVRSFSTQKEIVFNAPDEVAAKEIFSIFQTDLAKGYKRWSISLQKVRVDDGVVHRISTICTAVSKKV